MAKKSKKKQATSSDGPSIKNIAENRKARHRFEILESVECGVMLRGSEVKTLRDGKVSLEEAYGRVRDGELWLVNCDIPEYKQATVWNHEPKRPRKLLVHRRQLEKLTTRAREKGFTLVPLHLYFSERGLVKLVLGVCKGKKLHDKRETLKRADAARRIDRTMKNR
jgi:SsrA-binding protein